MSFFRSLSSDTMVACVQRKLAERPDFLVMNYMLGPDRLYEFAHSAGLVDPDLRAAAPPIPPKKLRLGTAAPEEAIFLWSGGVDLDIFLNIHAKHGAVVEGGALSVLDFGCGCGRLCRYFEGSDRYRVSAAEIDPALVEWCQSNLKRVDTRSNGASPPAPFEAHTFDLIYSLSVFTHLPLHLTEAWLADFARMAKPGGLLVVTTHGDHALSIIQPSEVHQKLFAITAAEIGILRQRLSSEHYIFLPYPDEVIRFGKVGEYGSTFMDPAYAGEHWDRPPWKLIEYRPGGLRSWQDIYVLRRVAG
jgi:SAM-dependent methyltransferase